MKKRIFLLAASCLLLATNMAFASIEIDPIRLELELDAGGTHSDYLNLTNHGSEAVEISLSTGEYRYMFSNNTIYPQPPKSRTLPSCRAWINFKPNKIKLQKDQKQQVQYTINVPAASADEYLAAIVIDEAQKAPDFQPGETGRVRIKITPRISIPVYVAIKKLLKRSCEISALSGAMSEDKKSVEFSVTLKNTGTVHIRPQTALLVLDKAGAVANKIPLGKSLPIFAGFGEKLSASWTPRFSGKYTLVATVDIGTGELIQKSIQFEVKK